MGATWLWGHVAEPRGPMRGLHGAEVTSGAIYIYYIYDL